MTARVLSAASCRFESASVDLSSHDENPASVFDGVPSEFAYPFDRWDAEAGFAGRDRSPPFSSSSRQTLKATESKLNRGTYSGPEI
jgi:hypothetical protein